MWPLLFIRPKLIRPSPWYFFQGVPMVERGTPDIKTFFLPAKGLSRLWCDWEGHSLPHRHGKQRKYLIKCKPVRTPLLGRGIGAIIESDYRFF